MGDRDGSRNVGFFSTTDMTNGVKGFYLYILSWLRNHVIDLSLTRFCHLLFVYTEPLMPVVSYFS
jgi:hypothetical protein